MVDTAIAIEPPCSNHITISASSNFSSHKNLILLQNQTSSIQPVSSNHISKMENYTSFLQFSSPTTSGNSSMSLTIGNNSHGFSDLENTKTNGFLGLMPGDDMHVQTGLSVNKISEDKSFVGSETEAKFSKKKGEKKVRKPRYAFQTRSQVDILDDGYRWRKYGQKAVKNNKFPRSYYRCTHQGCNVKKQVQRLTKDEGVVVTTYEGMHSHAIEKSTDNFEHILSQMQIYTAF